MVIFKVYPSNLILKQEIEQIVDARSDLNTRERAEHLISLGKVNLSTLHDEVITGSVNEYPIELHLKKNSLHLQSNCACVKKSNRLCVHGTAFLLQLTQTLKTSSMASHGVKFWRQMVREMEPDNLKALVVDFARRNKSFALELQAMQVANPGANKPFDLADKLLKDAKEPIVKSAKKPTATQTRLAISTCKALLKSCKSLIDGEYPSDGSKILVKIIETLHYVVHKKKIQDSTTAKLLSKAQSLLIETLPLLRSPEIHDQIFQYFNQMVGKSYFSPFNEDFLQKAFQALVLKDHKTAFLQTIEEQIHQNEGVFQFQWMAEWLNCLSFLPEKTELTYQLSEEEVHLLWKVYAQNAPEKLPIVILETLFAAVPHSMQQLAFEHAVERKLWHHAAILLKAPGIKLDAVDQDEASLIIQQIDEKSGNENIPETYYSILLEKCGDLKRIVKYVNDKNSLEVTARFVHLNTVQNGFLCTDFLVEQIDTYLSHHIGPASRRVIQRLLEGVQESQNQNIINDITVHLREKHGIEKTTELDSVPKAFFHK